ncbi:MAG: adenylate cyclase, partial [Pseudomonadota bacterium]|nr:adenylate cyclase [Pseudomonadota bacterium]
SEAPPPLPDYEQPPCPEEGYLWTPGYWGYGRGGYFWVPGTWVQPPRVGVLWTPGYWGFVGGVYAFHTGYWGPHVGFYGGVNYGYGYGGAGYVGGRWSGSSFAYNRTVNNVNVTNVHNTYNETVINNFTVNKVSYNGGTGGLAVAPTAQEKAASREQHLAQTPLQRQHVQEAVRNPALSVRENGGHPAIAATPRAAAFNAPGVVRARGAPPLRAPAAAAPRAEGEGRFQGGNQQGSNQQGSNQQIARSRVNNGSRASPAAGGQPNAGGRSHLPVKPQRAKAQEARKHEPEGGNKAR